MLKRAFTSASIILLFGSYSVHSQENGWNLYPGKTTKPSDETKEKAQKSSADLNYEMDAELSKYISMVDSMDRENSGPEGFRIQIYSGSGANSRQVAYENQSAFLSLYPAVKCYTLWDYPNWVVRVGDFRTKLEAQEYHIELREEYPASFIMGGKISIKD